MNILSLLLTVVIIISIVAFLVLYFDCMEDPKDIQNIINEGSSVPSVFIIPDEALEDEYLIASFDNMFSLHNNPLKYQLIGMFSDPMLVAPNTNYSTNSDFIGADDSFYEIDWDGYNPNKNILPQGYNQFNWESQDPAFTTCVPFGWESKEGHGPGNSMTCEYLIGAIKLKNIEIRYNYINFWSSSNAAIDSVGIKLLNHDTTVTLAYWTDNNCYIYHEYPSGNQHWKYFDVSAIQGAKVDILIFDMSSSIPCGSIDFDYFYQSNTPRGSLADTARSLPRFDIDSDGDGIEDARDAFPANSNEWSDRDFDGVADNADLFPGDPSEDKDSDFDGIGDNVDASKDDPSVKFTVTNLILHQEGTNPINIIETFDDPLAIQADKDRFDLTGIFSSKVVARKGWESKSWPARIGMSSVSTFQLGIGVAESGSIRIKGVDIHSSYINFLMSGGFKPFEKNNQQSAGVNLYLSGTNITLASYISDTVWTVLRPSDNPWQHFDVSVLKGKSVDIFIFEEGTQYLAFDHFYQGNVPQGKLADTARLPVVQESAGTIDERRVP